MPKLARSVNKCAASVAMAKLLAMKPPWREQGVFGFKNL